MQSQADDKLHRQRMEAARMLLREFRGSYSRDDKIRKPRPAPSSAPASRRTNETRYIPARNTPDATACSAVRQPQANAYANAVLSAEATKTAKLAKNTQQSPRLGIGPSHRDSCSENNPPALSIRNIGGHQSALGSFDGKSHAMETVNNIPVTASFEATKHTQEEDLIDLNWSTESTEYGPPAANRAPSQASSKPPSSFLDFSVETDAELGNLSHKLSQLNISQTNPNRPENNPNKCAEQVSRGEPKTNTRVISLEAVQRLLTHLMEGLEKHPTWKLWENRDFFDISEHQLRSPSPTTVPVANENGDNCKHQPVLDVATKQTPTDAKGFTAALEKSRCGCDKGVDLFLRVDRTSSDTVEGLSSDLKTLIARANEREPAGRETEQLAALVLIQSHQETCRIRRLLAEYYRFGFGGNPATGQDPDKDQQAPGSCINTHPVNESNKRRKGLADSKYA